MTFLSRGVGRSKNFVTGTAVAALVACGGGGGGGGGVGGSGAPGASALQGTAATGAALANAVVTITDSSGTSPCEQTSITTNSLGNYSCTLKAGKTAPFFVVVTHPTGDTPLVSALATTPAVGTTATVNVTPLTTAIVGQLSAGGTGNALSVVSAADLNPTALTTTTANVVAQLANILSSLGAPSGYDPFSTSIIAATAAGTGNLADFILDVVRIGTDPADGAAAFSTVDSPSPIRLATATTPGNVAGSLAPTVITLAKATQIGAQALTNCFAVPKAQRVLTVVTFTEAEGGPTVDEVAPACEEITADTINGAGIDYLHNGYRAGQHFYNLLTDEKMDGAKFSPPQILNFLPADPLAASTSVERYDRATLNINYLDKFGTPGSIITVTARLPNTATPSRATDWWLVGNQQAVDTSPRLNIRRIEQMNAASIDTNRISTYQTGIQFNINSTGPGSFLDGSALTLARVTGPGLALNGLVYKTFGDQKTMDLINKSGSLTSGTRCGGVSTNCPNIWFSRTNGLSGNNATTLATNPSGLLWAQSGEGFDSSMLVKGAKYKIELFYGSNTGAPNRTVIKTLLYDLVQATQASRLPWNSLGPKSILALDPNGSLNGQQVNSLQLDWLQNPSAQQIGDVHGVINNPSTFGPLRSVPLGALSVTLDNQTIPMFSTDTRRTLSYNYRTLDGFSKRAVYQYN